MPKHNLPLKHSEKPLDGIGLSFKDGWTFGIGFGLAMAIAVPLILILLGCVIAFGLAMIGGSLGGLL